MVLSDFVRSLQGLGLRVTASQVRWAIASEGISRPPLDGSLSFDFGNDHIEEFREYYDKLKRREPKGKSIRRKASMMVASNEED
jgi:hypothetical protein